MAQWGSFDFSEVEKVAKSLQKSLDNRMIDQFIRDFLVEMANRALRKVKMRTPANTGDLRKRWRVGEVVRIGDGYEVELFNPLEYASYVESGFRAHWVPGSWKGKEFVYDRDAKTGMYVGDSKKGWVEGKFMMAISMKEIEQELPRYLERRQAQLLQKILGDLGG